MNYIKTITYGNYLELYKYEHVPFNIGRNKQTFFDSNFNEIVEDIEDVREPRQKKERRQDSYKRASLAFKRLLSANMGESNFPVLITLTYSENIKEIKFARKDYNAFAKSLRYIFGQKIKYICVSEFQSSGRVHFHTLVWFLPFGVAESERNSRLVASLWGKGFVDIVQTDGSRLLINYLSKYLTKNFNDRRLDGMKLYLCSRNVLRPVVTCGDFLARFELSTAVVLQQKDFDTLWLGKGRYQLIRLN